MVDFALCMSQASLAVAVLKMQERIQASSFNFYSDVKAMPKFHRICWIGRDPSRSSSPAPGPAQHHHQESHHVPKSVVQMLNSARLRAVTSDHFPGRIFCPTPILQVAQTSQKCGVSHKPHLAWTHKNHRKDPLL